MLFIAFLYSGYSEDLYKNFIISLNKSYIYQFPSDILKNIEREQKPKYLTIEQNHYYENYAGLYYEKDQISIEKQLYNVYQIKPANGTWGNYYSFGKWSSGIDYEPKWKEIYYYDSGCIEEITDFTKSPFPDRYVKVAGPNFTNPFIYELINVKKKDSYIGIANSQKIGERKIRSTLIDFISNLKSKNYSALYKYIDNDKGVISFGYNKGEYSLSNTYSLNEFFNYMKMSIEYSNQPFDVYVNVYFSDTYKRISDKFGNATLIEFRFDQSYDYLAFVLTQTADGIYIIGIRNELDME